MIIRNKLLLRLLKKSKISLAHTKDEYLRLSIFEKVVSEHIAREQLSDLTRIECHRLLVQINERQVLVLEEKLGLDINNDGKIGRRSA